MIIIIRRHEECKIHCSITFQNAFKAAVAKYVCSFPSESFELKLFLTCTLLASYSFPFVYFCAAQRSAAQRSAAQRSTKQRNAAQRSATQRNATQRNATQRNATQRSAMRCDAMRCNILQLFSQHLVG